MINQCSLYPKFAVTDPWGRRWMLSATGGKYYRAPIPLALPEDLVNGMQQISQTTYALALLAAHERESEVCRSPVRSSTRSAQASSTREEGEEPFPGSLPQPS